MKSFFDCFKTVNFVFCKKPIMCYNDKYGWTFIIKENINCTERNIVYICFTASLVKGG